MTIPSDCAFSQTQIDSIRQQAQGIQQQLQSLKVEENSEEIDQSVQFWCALSRLINAPQDYFNTAIYALVPPLDEFIKHEADGKYCSRIGMPILNKKAFIRIQLQQKMQCIDYSEIQRVLKRANQIKLQFQIGGGRSREYTYELDKTAVADLEVSLEELPLKLQVQLKFKFIKSPQIHLDADEWFTAVIETRRFDVLDFAVPVLQRQSPMDKNVQYIASYVDQDDSRDKQNDLIQIERQIHFAVVNVNNVQDLNSLLSVFLSGPSIHYLERIIESPQNANFVIPPYGHRMNIHSKIHETRQSGLFRVSVSVSSVGTQTTVDLVHDALCQRLRYLQQNNIEIAKGVMIDDIVNDDDDGLMRDDRVDIVDLID